MSRLIHCVSSIALPHAWYETEWTERGTVVHDYLHHVNVHGRDAAIEMTPDAYRDACASLDLSGLDTQLRLGAEVALAYDCETHTARELGRGFDGPGIYSDVRDSEIPERMDVVGVREIPQADGSRPIRRGLVVSWKTGFLTRKKKVEEDYQLKIEALAAARAWNLDIVEVQLINIEENRKPYIRRAVYDAFDIDAIEIEIDSYYKRAKEARALYEAGLMPDKFEMGAWCDRCPSSKFCPAKVGEVRALVSGDQLKEALQIAGAGIEAKDLRWARLTLETAKRDLRAFERMVIGAEEAHFASGGAPVFLEDLPDGKQRYMGRVLKEGNEDVNGDLAFEVLAEIGDILAAAVDGRGRRLLTQEQLEAVDIEALSCDATRIESSKSAIEEALKKHLPPGKASGAKEAIFNEMRRRGSITRKLVDRVEEIVTKNGNPPPTHPGLEAPEEPEK